MKKLIYILIILAFLGCEKNTDVNPKQGILEYKIDAIYDAYLRYYYEGICITKIIEGDFYESMSVIPGDTTMIWYEPKTTAPYLVQVYYSGILKYEYSGAGEMCGYWWVVE